jgi:hypothetical protein
MKDRGHRAAGGAYRPLLHHRLLSVCCSTSRERSAPARAHGPHRRTFWFGHGCLGHRPPTATRGAAPPLRASPASTGSLAGLGLGKEFLARSLPWLGASSFPEGGGGRSRGLAFGFWAPARRRRRECYSMGAALSCGGAQSSPKRHRGWPRRIVIIRHGNSKGNVDETEYSRTPDSRVELTEKGWEQARQAGEQLRAMLLPDGRASRVFVYCSPYIRCQQTLEGVLKGANIPRDSLAGDVTDFGADASVQDRTASLRHLLLSLPAG